MVGTVHNNNYTLGRGELSFALFDSPATQRAQGFRYLGNTPTFNLAVATTDLDHFSSDHGLKTRDNQITLEVNRTGTFETDDISLDNLALLFFGSKAITTGSVSTVAAEAHPLVIAGGIVPLGMTAANPAGVKNLSAVTSVTDDSATPVTYVAGTDYTVNLATGIITLVPVSAGGSITTGKNLRVSYSTTAQVVDQVISGNTPIEGALMFVAYNPVGNNIDYFIPWAKLSPDGDYPLKGDTWQVMKFKFTILDPKDGRAAIYASGRPYLTGAADVY